MTRRLLALFGAALVTLSVLTLPAVRADVRAVGPAATADGCTTGKPPAYFLGVVYDSEQRDDFILDVGNFEHMLGKLRGSYCIGSSGATILAFENNWKAPSGTTYQAGSEINVKNEIARLGAAANANAGSRFFFFLSSHGSMWPGLITDACPITRVGSTAGLLDGGGQDGFLDDCELGDALNAHVKSVPSFIAVDCSFCGGFSDSITAVSGTIEDGAATGPSGILAPTRVVVTGCAITTECFGSHGGGNPYRLFRDILNGGIAACDGWTAPDFPATQGLDIAVQGATDGRCTASEMFFAAVNRSYMLPSGRLVDDINTIQQQMRIKYGFATLADDIPILL